MAALDGWRAIALVAVLLCHGVPPGSILWPLRMFGIPAVHLFFVLSGLLIARQLWDEGDDARLSPGRFWARRATRLLPALVAFLVVVALLGAPAREVMASAFFFRNYLVPFRGLSPYADHLWSLAVEAQFYLVAPWLLRAPATRRFVGVLAVGLVLAPMWRAVDDHLGLLSGVFAGAPAKLRTDRVFDFVLWGVTLAAAERHPRLREGMKCWLRGPLWIALAAGWALVVWKKPIFGETLQGLFAALLIAGTLVRPEGLPARLLALRPMAAVGRISYGLYLWQYLFFVAAYRPAAGPQRFPLNLVLVFVCAIASHLLVERPARRLLLGRTSTAA